MEAPLEGRPMSLFGNLFNKPQPPAAAPWRGTDINGFVTELNAIGLQDGFLSFRPGGKFNQQCRHIRAREIGMRLNMIGGSSLMRKVYERVDCPKSRQLAAAWDEIGNWAA
jgi:hypothetical protein